MNTRPPFSAFLIVLLVIAIVSLVAGCAQIPVARTYSVSYGAAQVSVRFEPPAKADPKALKEPITTVDLRQEKVIDPGSSAGPIIVTRNPALQ